MVDGLLPINNVIDINSPKNNKLEPVHSTKEINDYNSQTYNKLKEIEKNEKSEEKIYEFSISNTKFFYNSEAKEFVVKVDRNGAISQYPSDYLLRLKTKLL